MRLIVVFDWSHCVCRIDQVAGALTRANLAYCGIDDAGATTLAAALRYMTPPPPLLLRYVFKWLFPLLRHIAVPDIIMFENVFILIMFFCLDVFQFFTPIANFGS